MPRPIILPTLFALPLLLLPAAPAAAQEPTLVVENARVWPGDGTVLEQGTVVVADDRIVAIETGPVEAPGARRIEAAGRTVLPGLIDTHVHLLMEKLHEQPRTDDEIAPFLAEGVPQRLEAFLEAGITTVFSTGDYWPFVREIRDRVRRGDLPGPDLYTAGKLATSPGGHPASSFCGSFDRGGPNPWCREHLTVGVDGPGDARDAVAGLATKDVDALKIVWDKVLGSTVLDAETVSSLIDAAHDRDLRAYAHILEMEKTIRAVEMGLDVLVHLPVAGPEPEPLERLTDLMTREEVSAATTLVVFETMARGAAEEGDEEVAGALTHSLAGMRRTLAHLAEEAPDLVALGTDSPHLPPADAYHREIELVSAAGLTPEQILRAATVNAATHLDLDEEIGTLEAGKRADLILVEGDPLSDPSALRDVAVVIQAGNVVVED